MQSNIYLAKPLHLHDRTGLLSLVTPKPAHIGKFERLPKWVNCIPLIVQWLWLAILYRSITLPSVANPYITCGGMVGDGKLEYFNCMGDTAIQYVAPYAAVTIENDACLFTALQVMQENHLHFPIIVKPNLGWCGYGVCLVSSKEELKQYFDHFPQGETVILQRYLPETREAGLFYMRQPHEHTGKLIGITLRYFPQVVGDGTHSIKQLIAKDERLQRLENNKLHHCTLDKDKIPEKDQVIRLATIGSTRVGGLYRDGGEYITPELTKVIDRISLDMPKFFVGRFDVRFESLEKLKMGQGFTIMEVNGSGSESVHAWDPKYTMMQSYRIIFEKQRMLFHIGAVNRRNGYKPLGLYKLAQLYFHQQMLIKRYPLSN